VELPKSVQERLDRLAPDQRAAATSPPGPVLCVAPAGSGKTTTLVARIAWLVGSGVARPDEIAAITFNKRAAEELRGRLDQALEPLGVEPGAVRVRTFHALGREILRDAGESVEPLVDRMALVDRLFAIMPPAERRRLDTAFSRLKLDLCVTADLVAADPAAGPIARAFVAYERAIAAEGGLDFDDLIVRALAVLEREAAVLSRWHARAAHLLVDEVQDVDRSQLRLALLVAAPENRIFLVGDDDQSIYGWRLADVRRLLGLAREALAGLTRVDLEVNYRCPAPVLARSVRLIEHNRERFAKAIRSGPKAGGRLVLAPSAADDVDRARAILASWSGEAGSRALLARTNRELLPGVAAAIRMRLPFRARDLELPVESPRIDPLLARLDESPTVQHVSPAATLLLRIGHLRRELARSNSMPPPDAKIGRPLEGADEDSPADDELLAALLGWAASCRDPAELDARIAAARAALVELRRDDAELSLATAHGTKGLEFDHVAVVGLDAGRFPSARSVQEAVEPERALEEERRLAYVAWTRARQSLTLVYDPGSPSQFLLEAFGPEELGVAPRVS
jgi:DNA helicase-2/ATP-dependent DNA helicase PcrA